jgi:hypothetical protein
MRAARDVQARKAYVARRRDRLEAALGAAMNALADARPEGPLTYLGRWLLEQGAKEGEITPQPANAHPDAAASLGLFSPTTAIINGKPVYMHATKPNIMLRSMPNGDWCIGMKSELEAQSEVPEALRPLREKAATALGPIKPAAATEGAEHDATHGGDHAAKLPEALRTFAPLAEAPTIKAACALLHELELNVARAPDSKEAVDALRAQLVKVDKEMATEIQKRTEGVSDEAAKELVEKCEKAITAGNKDFQRVYDNVFNVIKSGDADGTAKYEAAVGDLDAAIEKPATAEQRDEAGVAAVLFADAARTKPSFDVVVRELKAATGAVLELAVLSAKEDTGASDGGGAGQGEERKAKTGLKKTSRVVEKSALRPGAGRGRSKWVCDVVRAMLVATSMSAVGSIVRGLLALHEAGALRVVRIKDRFAQPSAGGWRDLMVNFVIVGDPTRHVCEVQVVHEMMLTARKGLPGHAIYGIVRSAMELIESCGRERELRREAVRSMVAAGATDVELIGAFEDAWILEDPEWAAGVEGGRDGLGRALTADKEEGRVRGLELSERWKGEALPASVARLTALRELTMTDCKSLKSVAVLPASVTQISERAFRGCTSLASITIPESVTQIGEHAFRGCTSLASITIPASVTQIGGHAFCECTSLASMRREAVRSMVAAGATEVELIGAFEDAWILEDPEWVAGVEGGREVLGRALIADKKEGRVVGLRLSGKWKGEALPASVARLTALRELKMSNCTSLKSVAVLPASVTQIGECAFQGCTSLSSITLPASVTKIGEYAFRGCASLASITIPESVTQIGGWAFSGCTLASITLPESVTQISERAFQNCFSLASITIPASVTQIGSGAFQNCTSLASITIPESVTYIGYETFIGCTSLASITIPESVTQIGDQAFRDCTSLFSISIPSSTVVERGAFSAHTQVTRA